MSFEDCSSVAEIDRGAPRIFPAAFSDPPPADGAVRAAPNPAPNPAPTKTAAAATATAILIVGHGSREARANQELEQLVAAYRVHLMARGDATTVAHAYVELARPLLDEALSAVAAAHRRVVVVPLFLFLVGHAKNDIPIALSRARAAYPQVEFLSARELGVHRALLDIAFDRVAACAPEDAPPAEAQAAKRTTVMVVGRGSSDPSANAEFYRWARLFSEGRGFCAVLPAFIGITAPLVPDALETAARGRPERLVVLPYFLFGGRLADKLAAEVGVFAARYPWIRTAVAGYLGPDPRLLDIIDERAAEAIAGRAALPCDSCHYRAPIAGVVKDVGGERALLWSLRHSWTHGQAAPHRHAHRALAKHVLVCGNIDCAADGSIALIETLRRAIKDAGRQADIRVTRTSCMGRCGEGPTVAVYPDGIWYRKVHADDAEEMVREHLIGDRLVARLVDNIMQ